MKLKKSTIIKIVTVLAIVLICIFVKPVNEKLKEMTLLFKGSSTTEVLENVKTYILSYGNLAIFISFMLMVFQSIAAPIPAFFITFANAAIFGWKFGAFLSWSSAMAGAILCFYIARFLGRGVAEKLATKFALNEVEVFFDRYGNYTILIARLLPFVPFDPISYAAGLTSMSAWSFIWATGVGQLPATIIYSYIGGALTGGAKTFVMGLFILFAVSILVFLIKKIYTEKHKSKIKN